MPAVEMIRMTSSGTEASMSAIRLARAATGREKVLKFAGAYHGHVDGLLAEGGSGLATQGIPASPGVPAGGGRRHDRRPLERFRGGQPSGRRARAGGDPRRALPGQHGPGPSAVRIPRAPAGHGGRVRSAARVRRGHQRLPGGPGRRSGTVRSPPRPGRHGEGDRRRPPGGGVRRAARADGADRSGRRRLPGGHPVRESRSRSPPGSPRCGCSTTSPTPASPPRPTSWPAGCGRPRATGPCRSSRCPAS